MTVATAISRFSTRLVALGALAALACCSGCASERTVASVPAYPGMPSPMMAAAANDPPQTRVASSPLGYPFAPAGASLPTASAGAPSVRR